MKQIFVYIALLLSPLAVLAQQIVKGDGQSQAALLLNGRDRLLFFDGNPELKISDGSLADWYYEDGTVCITGSRTAYPDSGRGVRAVVQNAGGTSVSDTVYVFDFRDYRAHLDSVVVEAGCDSTTGTALRLVGDVPTITYTRMSNNKNVAYARACRISHTDVEWGGGEWTDVELSSRRNFTAGTILLPAFYRSTAFSVVFDTISYCLYDQWDSVFSEVVRPVAVRMKPTSVTTTRGTELENEDKRPITDSVLTGSSPLNILFHCNPTEAGEYFEWHVYKGAQLLTTRTDESVRYNFIDQGDYIVSGRAYSPECNCDPADGCTRDSVLFRVSVSQSLLKVPNVFTPNGDGVNDEFRVLYRSIREFHIWIYDRWGHLVYKSDDPAKGWDGKVNGSPAAAGAYFYVIRALGADAAADASYGSKISYQKKVKQSDSSMLGIYRLSGDINLIR